MTAGSRMSGNVGIRMVACVTVIVLLVVFFAVNYVRLMSMEKDTHTAVQAACLQAARDLSSIVVDGQLGRLSLVDDLSVKRPFIPSRTSYAGTMPKLAPREEEVRQVKSINTLLAEIRLRALIANQPEIINSTMIYRANADLHLAHNSINALKFKLENALANQAAFDKTGRELNIQRNVLNAYSNNQQKLGRIYSRLENLSFRLGTLSSRYHSVIGSLKTPRPADCDPQTAQEGGFYRAYKLYPVPGLPGETVEFVPDCRESTLVDNATFLPLSGNSSFPCAVQMEGDEVVTIIAPAGDGKPQTSKVHFIATAQIPSGPLYGADNHLEASPSGAFLLSFPQGFPVSPSEERFNFYSLISIMNASMLDAGQPDSKSPYKFWNQECAGIWREASNGTVPGGGSLVPMPYLGMRGRASDDPSVALSFLVYDWLSTLGLKPNVESVVKALTFDLRTYFHYRHNPSIEFSILSLMPDIQPARAEFGGHNFVSSAIFNVDLSGKTDPRNLDNWSKNPRLYERQQARMWSYLNPLSAFPNEAILVKMTGEGDVVTVDGNNLREAGKFMQDVVAMNHIGWQTYVNALTILNEKIAARFSSLKNQQVPAVSVTNAVIKENPRLAKALENAQYCMAVSTAMRKNLKTLTANGLRLVNRRHFALDTADFYPPTRAASREELIAGKFSDTGQDRTLNNRDWCGAKPIFITGSKVVLVVKREAQNSLPPAEASSFSYSSWNKFLFHLDLQAPSKAYQGQILMHRLDSSPYATVPLIKGQMHYQNTCALVTEVPSNPAYKICWQVQARDLNVNHFKGADADPKSSAAASYYADMDLNSYNGQVCKTSAMRGVCPPLACEFSISGPVIKAPEVENPQPVVLWSNWLAPSVVASSMSDQMLSVESGWQPTIYIPDGTALGKLKGRLSERDLSNQWWQEQRWLSDWWLTSGTLGHQSGAYPEPPPLAI